MSQVNNRKENTSFIRDRKTGEKPAVRRVVIESFGALKKVDVCLDKKLLTVIGPQAAGKSTFGKVVYFCRKIRDYLSDYAREIWNNGTEIEPFFGFLKYLRNPFIGCFGTTKHMDPFVIRYYYDTNRDLYVKITLDESHFARFFFSSGLRNDIEELINGAVAFVENNQFISFEDAVIKQSAFYSQFKNETKRIFKDDETLLYIPAGRNLLATIPDLIMPDLVYKKGNTHNVDITQIDLITQDFIHYIQRMRIRFGSRLEEMTENYLKTVKGQIRNHDVELACELIRSILKADYVYDKDGEKLYYSKEKWVKLMFGSSGQQEVLWALNCIFLSVLQNEKTFLVFEEPEAHIFPDAQELLSRLIVLLINSNGSNVLLTTHSPYILTSINLLVLSGLAEKEGNNGIIPRQCRLRKDVIAAFMIPENKGEFVDIVDKEEGLIDALEIDHISDSINEKIDQLLRIMTERKKGDH